MSIPYKYSQRLAVILNVIPSKSSSYKDWADDLVVLFEGCETAHQIGLDKRGENSTVELFFDPKAEPLPWNPIVILLTFAVKRKWLDPDDATRGWQEMIVSPKRRHPESVSEPFLESETSDLFS